MPVRPQFCCLVAAVSLAAGLGARGGGPPPAGERVERFDRDPGWDAHNNRSPTPEPRPIRQDFGYSRTSRAGAVPGEVSGFITPAAETAYYGNPVSERTLDQP